MTQPPPWLTAGHTHIWLPYTQMHTAELPLPVVAAEGCTLWLADGRELIDGIASWWSMCHGYQHPHIVEAMQRQVGELSHVMFAGLAHAPAYTLAERLAKLAPLGLNRVFFADSGSTSVEIAMKMAVQYWHNRGEPRRTKFISFENGYHGDTMGAMSLADPKKSMHSGFGGYMPKQNCLKIPTDEYSLAEFEELMSSGIHETIAALIIEPLVQGAGGFKFHSPDMLAEVRRICKANDILFIADEIATGFGRTGTMFACEQAGITPDIMCVGKGLTGGMISLAATLATDEIFEAFLSDELTDCFMHGPTYMANPLACAAANASLDVFEQEPRLEQVATIERYLYDALETFRDHENVADVRVLGAIGVIELRNTDWDQLFAMRKTLVEQGVWLRPFGNVIYIMPSFTISEAELQRLVGAVKAVLAK